MADDRASRRLEVDEQGIPRRISNDPWSNTTSRHAPGRLFTTVGATHLLIAGILYLVVCAVA